MNRVKLAKVVKELESGARPKGGVSAETGTIPSLGAEHLSENGGFNFHKNKFVTTKFYNELKLGKIKYNDILIVKDGATTGKVAFVERDFPFENAAINEHVFRIAINQQVAFPKYIYLFLKSSEGKKQILNDFRGATVGGISRNFIELTKIPLPSLNDQIRIATILTRAEKLIAKRKESIASLDELLRSVFWEMFGDPVKNKKQLQIVPLAKFLIHLTSGERGWSKFNSVEGSRFIRSLDVKMNYISMEEAVYVNLPKGKESARTKVQSKDVLLTITGSCIGRVAYVPAEFEEAYVSQHVAIIRTTDEINSIYLSFYLSMPNGGQLFIKKQQYGQTKPGLNLSQISSFPILLPPISKQNKFASIVKKVGILKEKYLQSLSEIENFYASLSQRAFKGDLDLNKVPLEIADKIIKVCDEGVAIDVMTNKVTVSEIDWEAELVKLMQSLPDATFKFDALMSEFENNSFFVEMSASEKRIAYDKIKETVYQMLEGENPRLQQFFDEKEKELVLRVNQ